MAPRLLPRPPSANRHETVEIQQRALAKKASSNSPRKSGDAADDAGQRIAGDAQVAFGQAERAGGEIVLAIATKARPTRSAVEIFEPTIVIAQAATASQNFSSHTPLPRPDQLRKGCGSVPHLIAAICWIISATASVDST